MRPKTGGAELGAQARKAGSLHRAGCEHGWAARRSGVRSRHNKVPFLPLNPSRRESQVDLECARPTRAF